MNFEFEQALRTAVALGIGLLLGLERERRKSRSAEPQAAGVRTFALVTVMGSITAMIPIAGLSLIVGGFVAGMAAVSYLRSSTSDPGITTEIALMTAYVLGLLTQFDLATAASLGVVVTILLAAREALHELVTDKLSEQEFHDALLLAAATLVILPLVPDRGVGPFQAFNPFTAWRFVVIVMVASSAGYVAQRLFGPQLGLPFAGFFGGFVSSTATIAAMRSRASGAVAVQPAVAGAVLSNVATVLQLGVVVASVSIETFLALLPSLVLGAIAAVAYGAAIALHPRSSIQAAPLPLGRPFELKSALILAALVSLVMVGSTVLLNLLGEGAQSLPRLWAGSPTPTRRLFPWRLW